MSFMQKQVQRNVWYEIDGDNGTTLVPADIVGDNPLEDFDESESISSAELTEIFGQFYDGREVYSVSRVTGWAFRLSAPGYMDCTEWTGLFDSAAEAWEACNSMYDSDDENDDDSDSEEIIISDLT